VAVGLVSVFVQITNSKKSLSLRSIVFVEKRLVDSGSISKIVAQLRSLYEIWTHRRTQDFRAAVRVEGFWIHFRRECSLHRRHWMRSTVGRWSDSAQASRTFSRSSVLHDQLLQPSWRHLTRWSSMLDSHHRVDSSQLRWSPTAQSTGMLFSSWASWAGDWWRRPGMFEHLRFYSNVFPLWCNNLLVLLHDGFIDDDRPE